MLFYIWLLKSISVPKTNAWPTLKKTENHCLFYLYLYSIVFICAVACS